MSNKVIIKQVIPAGNGNMFAVEFSCEAELTKDGNKWCCLIGENLQDGVAGFGDTVAQAINDCAIQATLSY